MMASQKVRPAALQFFSGSRHTLRISSPLKKHCALLDAIFTYPFVMKRLTNDS